MVILIGSCLEADGATPAPAPELECLIGLLQSGRKYRNLFFLSNVWKVLWPV